MGDYGWSRNFDTSEGVLLFLFMAPKVTVFNYSNLSLCPWYSAPYFFFPSCWASVCPAWALTRCAVIIKSSSIVKSRWLITSGFALLLVCLSFSLQADAIAACNLAMLNDFDGMSQEEMMACAEKLESPLKRLEEETKAKEAAEREAAEKAKVCPAGTCERPSVCCHVCHLFATLEGRSRSESSSSGC